MEADGIDEVASPTASALSSLEPSALGRGHELEDTVALARALTGRAPRKTFYRPADSAAADDGGAAAIAAGAGIASSDASSWVASSLAALPPLASPAPVDILDIGAGFGGLLFGLNLVFPGARKLALEIRGRVAEFVRLKVLAARAAGDAAARRCGVQRVNTMCQLPSFLPLASVSAIFICFPDPHFKRQNHRRRIISPALLSEYAAVLREGGLLFTITDVPALHDWMHTHLEDHPSFEATPAAADDPCVIAMRMATDEARKSLREGRHHQWNVYRRRSDADADAAAAAAGPFFGGYYGGVAVPITEKGVNDAPEMFHWTVLEREAAAKRAKLDGSGGAAGAGAGAAGAGTAGGAGAAAAASAADESGVGSTQATEAGAASA
ncbi:hypothetical protein FNF31_01185 [Cafeteria roenbergensis]|uniref:tRNA (guanine-N(7)-)-methyltransferase n=1 Tax=Cafeteria roenbergensis TaxID=33653 RepID=A0A5A8DSI9_CAFRO|nr:hypothetical protein FNF31_01185 [Cafeteria roenbergensis]